MTAGAAVALPAHWQRWHWSAAISAGRGIVAFSVPPAIEGTSRADLADLRIIDERGNETPFEIVMRLRHSHLALRQYAVKQRVSRRGMQTLVTVDAAAAHLPVSFVRLTSDTQHFSRHVTLEYSDDERVWSEAAGGRFERTAQQDHRTLVIPERRARYWRLTIEDADNAPLEQPALQLWGAPRFLVFDSRAPSRYRVVFGNRAAERPSYDFVTAYGARALANPSPASAGVPEKNAAFAPGAKPWSESHPWVLWGAVAAAIAGIGGLSLRVLTLK